MLKMTVSPTSHLLFVATRAGPDKDINKLIFTHHFMSPWYSAVFFRIACFTETSTFHKRLRRRLLGTQLQGSR